MPAGWALQYSLTLDEASISPTGNVIIIKVTLAALLLRNTQTSKRITRTPVTAATISGISASAEEAGPVAMSTI